MPLCRFPTGKLSQAFGVIYIQRRRPDSNRGMTALQAQCVLMSMRRKPNGGIGYDKSAPFARPSTTTQNHAKTRGIPGPVGGMVVAGGSLIDAPTRNNETGICSRAEGDRGIAKSGRWLRLPSTVE